MKWDMWLGNRAGGSVEEAVIWKKLLLRVTGRTVFLHKFVRPNSKDLFHSHSCTSLRVVLRGGYVEEVMGEGVRVCAPGHISVVRPDYTHRVDKLLNGPSYSLWISGKKTHPIHVYEL